MMTWIRLVLAIVIFPHGAQKVLGWFGGFGYSGTLSFFTERMGIAPFLAFLAILAEFAGALGLFAGGLSRIAAFGIACNMLVAIFMVHLPNGFFMNWMGTAPGEGFEYHLLVLGLAFAVIARGGGAYSVDRALTRSFSSSSTQKPALRRIA